MTIEGEDGGRKPSFLAEFDQLVEQLLVSKMDTVELTDGDGRIGKILRELVWASYLQHVLSKAKPAQESEESRGYTRNLSQSLTTPMDGRTIRAEQCSKSPQQ